MFNLFTNSLIILILVSLEKKLSIDRICVSPIPSKSARLTKKNFRLLVSNNFINSFIELKKLAKTLKQRCSSGGTVKDCVIEIQGDHAKILEQNLLELGYKTKSSKT